MNDHYFSRSPRADDSRRDVTVRVWDLELAMQSAGGTFSMGGLDKATAQLLDSTRPPAAGATVLDLGCGWGPIACALATAEPHAKVWAVDVNERARDLTAQNARHLGVTVRVVAPDDVPEDTRFDAIWSNPPIRIGKQALHDLLLHWLARLTPAGVAFLVVGKNLGADSLQRWLIEQGWQAERLSSSRGFRVMRVTRT